MKLKDFLYSYVLPPILLGIYRLLSWSWRIRLIEPPELKLLIEQKQPLIFAHWHGDELAIIHLVTRFKLATMTSTSRDGSLVDFVVRRLGGVTARGSSTRGGLGALRQMVRLVQNGRNASMAIDGPRGPIHVVKPGVIELARLTGAPIIPTVVFTRSAWRFPKSWNQTYLPKPGAEIWVKFAPPVYFEVGGDRKTSIARDVFCQELGKQLMADWNELKSQLN